MPSTDGPITIPAPISSTTEGSFTAGKETQQQRGRKGDRDDDQQVVERGHRGCAGVEGIAQ